MREHVVFLLLAAVLLGMAEHFSVDGVNCGQYPQKKGSPVIWVGLNQVPKAMK